MIRSPFPLSFSLSILAALLFLPFQPLRAQRGVELPAKDALEMIAHRYGDQSVEWIAEMRAVGGIPQPNEWEVLTYNKRSPLLMHWFHVGGGRARDEGIDTAHYPSRPPAGFLKRTAIKVDSVAAFTIAEGEARKARMAFDRVNFNLRVREFSREPIWRLELIDAERKLNGKVYLSGDSGEVLRTIWIYRGERARPDGKPLVIDSAEPRDTEITSAGSPRSATRNTPPAPERIPVPTDEPRTIDPIRPIRPLQPVEPANPATGTPEPVQPLPPRGDASRLAPRIPAGKPEIDTRIPPPPIPPGN